MIYELLHCCATFAILNVCFSVVYIMIYELLRCFATFAILQICFPVVYNDIRIASLLRNFRNSANLFPCSVIMIYELLRCFATFAILNVCFSVVYIMIYELLHCFAISAILPTFGIREFFFQKNCYFLMWVRNTKTLVFFCKQKNCILCSLYIIIALFVAFATEKCNIWYYNLKCKGKYIPLMGFHLV